MRVAVLVGGMYRGFDIAIKTWGNLMGYDFYFSTWDVSYESDKYDYFSVGDVTYVNDEMVRKHLPNVVTDFQKIYIKPFNNSGRQLFHWRNALKLCKESGKEYDLIIVTRPDLALQLFGNKSLLDCNEVNTIYYNCHNDNSFDDPFFMGEFNTIEKLINELKYSELLDTHSDVKKKIDELKINVGMIPLRYSVVRPNAYKIAEDEITFEHILAYEMEYIQYHKLYIPTNPWIVHLYDDRLSISHALRHLNIDITFDEFEELIEVVKNKKENYNARR